MDDRSCGRFPYVAVLTVLAWTERNWTWLDGQMQRSGIDLYERWNGPLYRFVALVVPFYVEYVHSALGGKDNEADRRAALEVLEWPARLRAAEDAEAEANARHAFEVLGLEPSILMGNGDDAPVEPPATE